MQYPRSAVYANSIPDDAGKLDRIAAIARHPDDLVIITKDDSTLMRLRAKTSARRVMQAVPQATVFPAPTDSYAWSFDNQLARAAMANGWYLRDAHGQVMLAWDDKHAWLDPSRRDYRDWCAEWLVGNVSSLYHGMSFEYFGVRPWLGHFRQSLPMPAAEFVEWWEQHSQRHFDIMATQLDGMGIPLIVGGDDQGPERELYEGAILEDFGNPDRARWETHVRRFHDYVRVDDGQWSIIKVFTATRSLWDFLAAFTWVFSGATFAPDTDKADPSMPLSVSMQRMEMGQPVSNEPAPLDSNTVCGYRTFRDGILAAGDGARDLTWSWTPALFEPDILQQYGDLMRDNFIARDWKVCTAIVQETVKATDMTQEQFDRILAAAQAAMPKQKA